MAYTLIDGNIDLIGIIPIGKYFLMLLQKTILLFWRTQITSRLRICSKIRKVNIEVALFTT